jgi:hypothetical protein
LSAPVTHHTDGRSSWSQDAKGFVRWRGITLSAALAMFITIVTTTGAPWWLSHLPKTSVELKYVVICTIVIWGTTLTLSLIYLRYRSRRSLRVKYLLHRLAHSGRDIQTKLEKENGNVDLTAVMKDFANLTQAYFKELIPHKDIQVSIRLASEEGEQLCYKTVARTAGLSPKREKISTPLKVDQGLGRFFQQESKYTGILIYHDLIAASKLQAYDLCETDKTFPNEIKTLMVAGMNGWDGEKESMLGLLYISSSHDNVFYHKHTDSLGYVADVIAMLISMIVSSNRKTPDNKHSRGSHNAK